MEILIAASAATAFVALIAYLWNSDPNSKKNNRQLVHDDGQEVAVNGDTTNLPPFPTGAEVNQIIALERTVAALSQERADLLVQLETTKREVNVDASKANAAHTSTMLLSQKIDALETENASLRNGMAELESARSEQKQMISNQLEELEHFAATDKELITLRQQNSELFEQLKQLQTEKENAQGAIKRLEALVANQSNLEAKLLSLSQENAQLLEQISELQLSMKDKIAEQIESLQELYQQLACA